MVQQKKENRGMVPLIPAMKMILTNKVFMVALLGQILITFAEGGIADWLPTYLNREAKISVGTAGTIVGGVTVIGGIGGTLLGGYLGDFFKNKTQLRHSYLSVSGWTSLIAVLFSLLTLYVGVYESYAGVIVFLTLAEIALFCNSGPINTELALAVPGSIRARAFGFSVLCIHMLGDAISPVIIGGISDSTGSLKTAVIIIPIAMIAAAVTWICGSLALPHTIQVIEIKTGEEFEIGLQTEDPLAKKVLA